MKIQQEKISERMFLVAVVDDSDLVVVAAAFDDEETAAQVFAFADILLKKTGVIAGAEDFPSPFMPYSEWRDSMLEFEGKEPVEKLYPMLHVINRKVVEQ